MCAMKQSVVEEKISEEFKRIVDNINEKLKKIDELIQEFLLHKKDNNEAILKEMSDIIGLIGALESEDEQQFGYFKYRYHMCRVVYFKAINSNKEADKDEKVAKKFEKTYKQCLAYMEGKLFEGNTRTSVASTLSENTFSNDSPDEKLENEMIGSALQELSKVSVKPDILNVIKNYFSQKVPGTLSDYMKMVATHQNIQGLLDACSATEINEQVENNDLLLSLKVLKDAAEQVFHRKKIAFVLMVLNAVNKESILFGDIMPTEENIKERLRELRREFHPDKSKTWTNAEQEKLLNTLFDFIGNTKETLLKKLKNDFMVGGELNYHEKNGNEYWELAYDYRAASKKEWGKLKVLKKSDIEAFDEETLLACSKDFINRAFVEYRAASKVADKNKILKKQYSLRGSMALCKHFEGDPLVAQLYAIGQLQLVIKYGHQLTKGDFNEAVKIFDKVSAKEKEAQSASELSQPAEAKKQGGMLVVFKGLELQPFAQGQSRDQAIDYQNDITSKLHALTPHLMLNAQRHLVKFQAAEEDIIRARAAGKRYKVGGVLVVAGAAGAGVVGAVGAGAVIAESVTLSAAAGTVAGPIGTVAGVAVGVVVGLVILGLGIWKAKAMYNQGNEILKEPEIRENLNNLIKQAIAAYDKNDYQQCLDELSKPYYLDRRLLTLKDADDTINYKDIILTLTGHGFRADGVAYLLNILGEVLSSGKVKVSGLTQKDIRGKARETYNSVLNKLLLDEAIKLDERITVLRKKDMSSYFKGSWSRFRDYVLLNEYSGIAKEHVNDANDMPFQSRLEEVRNIARINLAVLRIIEGGTEEITQAKVIIKDIRSSIEKHHQYFSISQARLLALDDLIWIMSGEPTEYLDEPLSIAYIKAAPSVAQEQSENQQYLQYLDVRLEEFLRASEKAGIYIQKAAYYESIAKKEKNSNHLESLKHWQFALNNYAEAIECLKDTIEDKVVERLDADAKIGYTRCLLKLSKFSEAIKFLTSNKNLANLPDYWIIGSVCFRKIKDYKNAKGYLAEALRLDPKNKVAIKQKEILNKLEARSVEKRVNSYQGSKVQHEESYLTVRRADETPSYRILSIDGGGIRGVMPALWLSEIEHRTHRPISHLFNMMSGTSTGAIISAGLSIPKKPSPAHAAHYSASDILQLYVGKSDQIFTNAGLLAGGLFSSKAKYTDGGRLSLFGSYFGERTLFESLTDLVIPVVSEADLTRTHLFTLYDARRDKANNATYVNTLMAATAAPTFFPTYSIKGKGTFLDGGVQANNPAHCAYREAIRYKQANKDKVFMLSLGTGSYIPEPLSPDLHRGLLFWAKNFANVALSAQEGNTDIQMHGLLGDNYHRWQVWLEKPIRLDQHEGIPTLLELGHQYMEELYASDSNEMNKLLEVLEPECTSPTSTSPMSPKSPDSGAEIKRQMDTPVSVGMATPTTSGTPSSYSSTDSDASSPFFLPGYRGSLSSSPPARGSISPPPVSTSGVPSGGAKKMANSK